MKDAAYGAGDPAFYSREYNNRALVPDNEQWVARWTSIAHPPETPLFGYLPETWWRATPLNRN